MATIIKCDRCKCEINDAQDVSFSLRIKIQYEARLENAVGEWLGYDLCPKCADALIKYITGKEVALYNVHD